MIEIGGDQEQLALQATIANDQDNAVGIATADWAKNILDPSSAIIHTYQRLDSIPFSSENKFFASLHARDTQSHMMMVN